VASLEGVMHGLYLLWWVQEKQMSPVVVAATLAAGDLAIMLLEVPTGWFADRYGHRRSLIFGSFVQVLGMLCCWLGQGIPGLIAASVLVALGDAFRSGADHALLYRTCIALGRETDFQRVQARTEAVRLTAMVGLVLAGGAIVTTWGFPAGWIAETVLCAAGLAMACAMTEPSSAEEPVLPASGAAVAPGSPSVPIRALIALAIPVSLLGSAASAASFLAQTSGHGEPGRMTVLIAVVTLAEAAGATLAMRAASAGITTVRVLFGLGAICAIVAVTIPVAFIPVVVVLALLDGIAHSVRAVAVQRAVPDHVRARAASLASACDQAIHFMTLPIAGFWQTRRRR
jgi:MFS family permease